ncbi:MAG TPA: beta-ketoacyl synthase chain length factor [Dongiaceae bacterium]|nr:beta-ketoacyl synthase chain length factor [Dongiaceae bacterium]
MNPVYVEAVSVLGPGLPDWQAAQSILRGDESYTFGPTPSVSCAYLTPNIKRRTSLHMHVALQAAEKALTQTHFDPSDVELLFASAEGDLHIADEIFVALTQPEKQVSPQKFQNVILNAAVGHLGIILGNKASATSVTGGEYSFAVGLLQAAISVATEDRPVLFIAYDALGPGHLDPRTVNGEPFSVGLLLSPIKTDRSLSSLAIRLEDGEEETSMDEGVLEKVRTSLGAARSLPLLTAIANATTQAIALPYCERSRLNVELQPCLQ